MGEKREWRFLWFQREDLNGDGLCPIYMTRWTLLKLWRGIGVYLHRFVRDDWSRDMHDHPKRFVSIGLWGRYREHYMRPVWVEDSYHGGPIQQLREASRVYRAPWFRTFPARHRHRITLIDGKPCWTLVIVLTLQRQWGFWHDGQWVPWRRYVRSDTAKAMKTCP